MDQRSPEWYQARLGKVTASRVADVIAKTKTGYSTSRANYMAELIAETLTGVPSANFTSGAMQWGIDNEEAARQAYELKTGELVTPASFVPHPIIVRAGASPDGYVGKNGLLETKCPLTATHIDTLLNEKNVSKYEPQMQWQMACTERDWCDFVSFDPRLPDPMHLYVARFERNDDYIKTITIEIDNFLMEMDEKLVMLRAKFGK